MGAWELGLFGNDSDADIVAALDTEAGVRDLHPSKKHKAKDKPPPKQTFMQDMLRGHTSAYPTICGGGSNPEGIRKHLDAGILEKLFAKKLKDIHDQKKDSFAPDYIFCVLGACAMSLGCKVPAKYKLELQKRFLQCGMLEAQERQMFDALNGPDGYQEGKLYAFELPADVVAAEEAESKKRSKGNVIMMNVPAPHSLFPRPPPKNKVMRTMMDEGKFGPKACGGCGAFKKEDGSDLMRCTKCKKREYCGVACQKEHWKLHKKVCKVAVEVKDEIPYDTGMRPESPD